jgi:hypothetical protein
VSPLIWRHDADAGPMPTSAFLSATGAAGESSLSRDVFGWADKYQERTHNGQPVAYATFHVYTADDAERLRRTKYVSPRVDVDYLDPNGREWPGYSIGHVAATPRPIQLRQRPVMLSHEGQPKRGTSRITVFLGGSAVADKADDKTTPADGNGAMGRVLKILKAKNMIADTVATVDDLAVALETWAAVTGGAPAPEPDGDEPTGDMDDGDNTEPVGDGGLSAAMLSTLAPPVRAAVERTITAEREALAGRVKAVLNHPKRSEILSPAEAQKFEKRVKTAPLNFASDGTVKPNAVTQELTTYERALRIKPGKGASLSTVRVPVPDLKRQDVTDPEQVKAAAAYLTSLVTTKRG